EPHGGRDQPVSHQRYARVSVARGNPKCSARRSDGHAPRGRRSAGHHQRPGTGAGCGRCGRQSESLLPRLLQRRLSGAVPGITEATTDAPIGFLMLSSLSGSVTVYEVSPRDGLQNEASILPIDAKRELIGALVRAGLKHIEVTSFVSP